MNDSSGRVVDSLKTLGFAVQPTSFSDITSVGEMSRVRKHHSLPDCESARILRYFPDFFAVHHSAPPQRGVFFVAIARGDMSLDGEAEAIYKRYFPTDLLVVGEDPNHRLLATWVDSGDGTAILPAMGMVTTH